MLNDPEILRRADEREKRSQEFYNAYKKGDESALGKFCQIDPFSMDTQWVKDAIQTAILTGNVKLLKELWKGKREGKGRVAMMIENLIIFDVCNQLAADEGWVFRSPEPFIERKAENDPEKKTVFDIVVERKLLSFQETREYNSKTIKRRYYDANKQLPDVMIERLFNGTIVRMGPEKIEMNHAIIIYGIHEIFFPDDGGEKTINVKAVFNNILSNNPQKVHSKPPLTR